MINAQDFLTECSKQGFNLFTGTPCSYLKPLINATISLPEFNFVDSTNEGDAVAIACGAWLGGGAAVAMFQNSGLGNAVNPITSLSRAFNIPFLGITTLRGEPGGKADEPQHQIMGAITSKFLEVMEVKWEWFPQTLDQIAPALKRAKEAFDNRQAYFFIMRDGDVDKFSLTKQEKLTVAAKADVTNKFIKELITRTQALELVKEYSNGAALLASTGKAGRELHDLGDNDQNFYMVGSMGCAPSLGLGIALTSSKKTIVIDGDGALMMRMGNMATLGRFNKNNLVHLLLDNEVHDSTGGQASGSENVAFAKIASACGYSECYEISRADDLISLLKTDFKGTAFIHMKIQAGSPEKLGRPKTTPIEVAERFKNFLKS